VENQPNDFRIFQPCSVHRECASWWMGYHDAS